MLPLLIYYNQSGRLSEAPQGGFLDHRGNGKPRLMCGTYRFLHKKTNAFPKLTKKQFLCRRASRPRGTKSSSKQIGQYCHVQVQHALLCVPMNKCECKAKGLVRKQSPSWAMVQAAKRFIQDQQLVPLCGELIIANPAWGLATRFDLLCERNPAHRVLVSWKTTGQCPFDPRMKKVGLSALVCQMPLATASSELLACREHTAQIALEAHILQTKHDVPLQQAFIVYLSPGQDSYRCIEVAELDTATAVAEWIAAHRL